MTFGRWLLVNSFSIFLVTLFVLGYFYRDELQLEQAYHQLLNFDSEQVVLPKTEPESSESRSSARKPTQKETSEPTKQNNLPLTVTLKRKPEKTEQTSPLVFVDKEMQTVSQSSGSINTPTQLPPTKELKLNEILQLARQSYWDKQYSDAINLYQNLILKDPQNPDYRGELGNIYYALNDYPNASNLYFQAAELLIAQSQRDRAISLVSPITAMNRELGTRLSESLR